MRAARWLQLWRAQRRPGLGEQGPLIEAGLPAVRLSADGELPIEPGRDTPESFDNLMRSELARWTRLIKEANIQMQ